ncbi:cysteine-rich venom protein [Microcaecilia unicolor]|uniref:Cysteine-rich venom protein-like n=1 Tax=Microcaecilia unicolor TaxID=1415580 RepID=A0A6P7XKZ1_9AMPH|nr:cysteine-rich venom protein-like [Microcaecilia unicolor]
MKEIIKITAFLCMTTLLQLSLVEADASLGSLLIRGNGRIRRALLQNTTSGRPVNFSLSDILKMRDVPFSSLSTMEKENQNDIVNIHNTLRRQVDPPASNMLKMKWSDEATKTAEEWANTCNLFHSPKDERKIKGFSCGENLFMSTFLASWPDVIKAFDSEKIDFDYGKGVKPGGGMIGHYLQVVWYSSFQVGCAVAQCPKSEFQYYYVCQYCPAGNIQHIINTPYKKGTPCGDCPNACDNGLCTNPCSHQDTYSNCVDYVQKPQCSKQDILDCPATCNCQNKEIK